MRRITALFCLGGLLAAAGFADKSAEKTAPLDAMIAADRAFGRMSGTRPVKEAFLEFLADDAILFRGGEAVQGKAWTREQPSPPFKLFLRPAWAGIARSGDLGWTVDPYDLNLDGREEVHYGEYLTVWRKDLDGRWRFVVNFGVHTPPPDGAPPAAPTLATLGDAEAAAGADPKAGLLAADRDLGAATAGEGGVAEAYLARLADDGILMRNGAAPSEGREPVRSALARAVPARMESRPEAGGVSTAGDLGYTWGHASWKDADGGTVTAHYLRVWERRGGAWKLKVDCVAEAPLPGPIPQPEPPPPVR